MRIAFALRALLLAGATSVLLAGCSGKPENSPVIRKKFAEYDKTNESVTALTARVQTLSEQIDRLAAENSELRALIPTQPVASTSVEKTSKTAKAGERLEATEGLSAAPAKTVDGVIADAAAGAPKLDLEAAPLAAPAAKPADAAKTVAAQQEAPAKKSFKEMTNAAAKKPETRKASSEAKKPEAKTTTRTVAKTAEKPTAKAKVAGRGSYHPIMQGETLQSIATKYGVSVEQLAKENRLPAGARIGPGQKLYIPR